MPPDRSLSLNATAFQSTNPKRRLLEFAWLRPLCDGGRTVGFSYTSCAIKELHIDRLSRATQTLGCKEGTASGR